MEALGAVREVVPPPYDELPGELGAFFRGELDDEWVPEVVAQSTTLTIVDVHGEDYLVERSRMLADRLYDGPILKNLVRILSPTLLVMGVSRRWSAVRRGSSMISSPVRREGRWHTTRLEITAPHPVFTESFARALVPVLEVAVERARGSQASSAIIKAEPRRLVFEGRWAS